MNSDTNNLSPIGDIPQSETPAPVAIHPDRRTLAALSALALAPGMTARYEAQAALRAWGNAAPGGER